MSNVLVSNDWIQAAQCMCAIMLHIQLRRSRLLVYTTEQDCRVMYTQITCIIKLYADESKIRGKAEKETVMLSIIPNHAINLAYVVLTDMI